jgi:hypothetical protein
MSEDELAALLGRSVDPSEAKRQIRDAAQQCSRRAPFSPDAALAVLDVLASRGGVIAVTARFAKARVLLMSPSTPRS